MDIEIYTFMFWLFIKFNYSPEENTVDIAHTG